MIHIGELRGIDLRHRRRGTSDATQRSPFARREQAKTKKRDKARYVEKFRVNSLADMDMCCSDPNRNASECRGCLADHHIRKKRWREDATGQLELVSDARLEFIVDNSKLDEDETDEYTLRVDLLGVQRTKKPAWARRFYVRTILACPSKTEADEDKAGKAYSETTNSTNKRTKQHTHTHTQAQRGSRSTRAQRRTAWTSGTSPSATRATTSPPRTARSRTAGAPASAGPSWARFAPSTCGAGGSAAGPGAARSGMRASHRSAVAFVRKKRNACLFTCFAMFCRSVVS